MIKTESWNILSAHPITKNTFYPFQNKHQKHISSMWDLDIAMVAAECDRTSLPPLYTKNGIMISMIIE